MSRDSRLSELARLGDQHRRAGNAAAAEPLLREALAIAEADFPHDGPKVASALNSLGLLYKDLARYDEARAVYEQQARNAVREVEEALLRLEAARQREADAQRAASGYRDYFAAAEQRWRVGAGSLIEMEDARRFALNAQAALIAVQRERVAAWITLYKATGGGWDAQAADPVASR